MTYDEMTEEAVKAINQEEHKLMCIKKIVGAYCNMERAFIDDNIESYQKAVVLKMEYDRLMKRR